MPHNKVRINACNISMSDQIFTICNFAFCRILAVMMFEIFAVLFLVYFVHYFVTTLIMRRNMPPGPFPYPFIGNIPHLLCDPVNPYGKLADKYGDIFTISLPSGDKIVILSTASLFREARLGNQENLYGKSPGAVYPWHEILGNDLITSDYSPAYRFRRRVFKTAMHVFGSGIEQTTERVRYAVNIAMEEIDSKEGQPFSPRNLLESSILVQLWDWLTSSKLEMNDPLIQNLSELNEILAKQVLLPSIYECIPFFSYLQAKANSDVRRAKEIRNTVFSQTYQSQKETYTPRVIRNLTDSFICCYEKEIGKETNKEIGSMSDITGLMADLTFAGSDTTSTSLTWFLLYMTLYPDIQDRVEKEINSVVNKNHLPNWKDAQNMPYLQATLCEVQRASGMIVIVGTSAIRDIEIAGYDIAKGTFVIVNVSKLHHDEREWAEPERFKPERFLDPDGKFIGWSKVKGFLPFSIGRRECPGQSLAKIMLYTFASILLYCYKFELPEGEEIPTTEVSEPAIIKRPKDFKVVARKRKF